MTEQTKTAFFAFQTAYYNESEGGNPKILPTWLGTRVHKWPFDLFVLQDIIYKIRPGIIIECGSETGGSALFMASICDLVRKGMVISIDHCSEKRPIHPRIDWMTGDVLDDSILQRLRIMTKDQPVVMAVLDDDHSKAHLLREMEIYGQFVTKGSYLVIEDTNINGHPVLPNWGDGPWEAVHDFLPKHPEFVQDKEMNERFENLTYFPGGYLLRIS